MKWALFLLTPFLIASCSSDPVAGGSGTATDNTMTAGAAVFSVDTLLPANAPKEAVAWPVLLRIRGADTLFRDAAADGSDLRVAKPDGTRLRFALRTWEPGRRSGSLWVLLDTLRRGVEQSIVLSWGRATNTPGSDAPGLWGLVAPAVRQSQASVLYTDFEDGTGFVLPLRHNVLYATRSDSTVTMSPSPSVDMGTRIVPVDDDAGSPNGKAFWIDYSASGSRWAQLGSALGDAPLDLSGLDSVTFRAKGKGTVRLCFGSPHTYPDSVNTGYAVTVDSLWRTYRVPASALVPLGSQGLSWAVLRSQVGCMALRFENGGSVYLDDIRLHGIGASDLK